MSMKRKTRAAGMLLLVMLFAALIPSGAWAAEVQEDVTPNAQAAILYEATTGTVLYEKNADTQLPPASMTKVMTASLVLEQNPELEGELTVDERAVSHYYCSSMEPMRHLYAGEVISYEDCLNYLLIPSGNEAGTAFAFELAGDMSAFADQMTAKAKELGCSVTVRVECELDETGFPYPFSVTVTGNLTEEQKKALRRSVEADFAIPAERQSFAGGQEAEANEG